MNLNLFLPSDRVHIPELDVDGVVVCVTITFHGTNYTVRYFKDDTPCECDFFDFEIAKIKQPKAIQQP